MYFFLILIIFIAIVILIPYIRFLFKRLSMSKKIKSVCTKLHYKFYKPSFFWMFGGRRKSKCDFYVETPTEVYAVKLFGVKKKNAELVFKQNGEYFERHYLALISYGGGVRFPMEKKPKKLPDYDFRHQYRMEWEIKSPHNILLINPVCREIHRQVQHGVENLLGAGDVVNGMEIYPLSGFLGELEKNDDLYSEFDRF